MKFQELNKMVKYCSNQINTDKFVRLMIPKYINEDYIMNLWPQFRDNLMIFITSRNEVELFNAITKEMEEINYQG